METDNTLLLVMLTLGFLGILGVAVYYIGRYSFKTDYDKDLEQVKAGFKEEAIAERQESKLAAGPDLKQTGAGAKDDVKKKTAEPALEKNLSQALQNTKTNFLGRLRGLFAASGLGQEDLDELEEVLYTSDLGPATVERLMEAVRDKLSGSERSQLESVTTALKQEMESIFASLNGQIHWGANLDSWYQHVDTTAGTHVMLIVGVNGAGKTTTIGKLAHGFATRGKKVLIAAGDTFRAAAGAQLQVWSERAQVEIFSPEGVTDPSAVAFDACQKAKSKDFKVVIIDTAGRLHTHKNLMDELVKMKRVIQKVFPQAPHETLLVVDSNSGQNALIQARQFHEALSLSGVILTKLDGTAKGGVAVGIVNELRVPIQLIGIGEGINDLRPFNAHEFVESIL